MGIPMKLLIVGAGASFSTKDVEMGYLEAFQGMGVDIELYLLDRRISVADKWLNYTWRYLMKKDSDRKPTWSDVVYRAGIESLEMALRFDVDWIVVVSAMYLHPDVLVMMRRAGKKVCVLLTESPYEDEKQARVAKLANVCFTNERTSVLPLRDLSKNPYIHYIRHAYSSVRHWAPVENPVHATWDPCECAGVTKKTDDAGGVDDEVECHDVVFVGSGFQERLDLLDSIDWKGVNLGLYGTWSLLPRRHRLRKYIRAGIINNTKTFELYKRAKIGLNLYRTSRLYKIDAEQVFGAESLNPRAYELAASGTFCLSDYRMEGPQTFDESQPTFTGPGDLQKKLDYYLSDGGERYKLASLAQEKVRSHTFEDRARQVLAYLSSYDEEESSR